MKEEDTIGLMVMVSPVLWTSDHVGKIGTIEFTDFTEDKIWVRFEDEEVDCFSSKTLFILRASDELIALAETYQAVQWPPVSQNLQTLALLQASGSAKQLKDAFELLQDDPELHRVATIRLNEAIDFAPRRKIGR
ncbi:hypothetical protein [Mucilaginibacter gossypii]|uniref:Uncharacterized protein n=1 Tax=Mucilaginibacter gossypii TaxID=551996 RepID=A0A1G8BA36_9SPHI|nr:hypothetical protein [Mucilaginibacter gossypii]SDH30122.1 hypothetical protein SAMN05192573_108185 [Mucilaginibacter gossypii]